MLKRIKSVLGLFLTLVLLFGLFPSITLPAKAADSVAVGSEIQMKYRETQYEYLMIDGSVKRMRYTYFDFEDGTEHPVYCIDPAYGGAYEVTGGDPTKAAIWVPQGTPNDPRYIMFMQEGYPHRQSVLDALGYEGAAYYATKIALWCYILGETPANLSVNPAGGPDAQAVLEVATAIYNAAMARDISGGVTAPELKVEPPPIIQMTDNGTEWEGTVTVTWNTWIGDDPSASGDIELSWASTPALTGLQIILPDGTDITSTMKIPTDGVNPRTVTLTVKAPKAGNPDEYTLPELKATALMAGDNFFVAQYKPDPSSTYGNQVQRYLVEGAPKADQDASTQLQYGEPTEPTPTPPPSESPPPEEPGSGTGKIKKVAAGTNQPLAGAVIRITQRAPTMKVIGDYVTDTSGGIEVELEEGEYDAEEITPPSGYVLDENPIKRFTIIADSTSEVTFANKKKGTLELLKIDGKTGAPLAGVTLKIALDGGSESYEGVTGADGKFAVPDLKDGTWFVTETATLPGFIRDKSTKTVKIVAGEPSPNTVVFQNFPFEVLKVDEADGRPLAGAEIAIYAVGGGLIYQGLTGADGKLSNLPPLDEGAYEIVEIAAPDGYLKDPNHRVVQLKADGSGASQVKFDNVKKPSMRIYKVNAQNQLQGIAGVVYTVTFPNGQTKDYTTNAQGEILVEDLEPGIYIVTEKSVPAPYILDPYPRRVDIKSGDKEVPVWFVNYPEPGFKLIKLDSQTYQPLPGVQFKVRGLESSNSYINLEGLTTDINGVIDIDHLPEGMYEFTEMLAPNGYIIDNRPKIVELHRSQNPNQDTKLLFTNTKLPTFELLKLDAKTGLPLPGATFSITRIIDGARYLDRVTDANGKITITDFPPLNGSNNEHITLDDFNNGIVLSVREIHAPDGYLIDPQEYHVQLFPGEKSQLVVNNYQMPDLEIIKLDMETRQPVPGAKYTIEMADGFTITDAVTDANGRILVSEWYAGKPLIPGVYKITEVSVPHPYILDPIPRYITFVPNRVNTVMFENWKMKRIKVYKYDMDTAQPLANAEFSVKVKGSDIILGEGLTNSEGYWEGPYMAPGWHTITEMAPPPGYLNSDPQSRDIFVIPGQEVVIKFDNLKKPGVYIYKYDEYTTEPLPGTEFSIAHRDGPVIFEGFTNESGYIYLDNLDDGWYTVTEMKPPPGYLNSDTPKREFYAEAGKIITIKFDNVRLPILIVTKTDASTGKGLAGALMKVQYRNAYGGLDDLGTYRTNENGQIIMPNMQPGDYVITEIQPPPGYSMPSNPVTYIHLAPGENAYLSGLFTGNEDSAHDSLSRAFTVSYGESYVGQEVPNWPLNSIVIRKIDNVTGELLAGAAFELRKVTQDVSGGSGTILGRWTTNYTGTIIITGLEPGGYIVEEVQAPPYYTLNENSKQEAWIKADGTSIVELTFGNNPYPSLVVRKYDTQTKQPLAGAEFLITDSAGTVVGTSNGIFTTNANGLIEVGKLPKGSYVVTERKAPAGYLLADASQTIALTEWGRTYSVDFYDTKLSGAQIIKIDGETKLPLKDAQFNIYKKNGELVGTYTTNGDGIIIFDNLQPGWYKAVESKAPAGYILDDTPQDFEITSGQFVKLTFEDKKLAALQILKVSSVDDSPLAGAVFTVTKLDGTPVGTYTTNASGLISLPNTLPGWYVITETKAPAEYTIDNPSQTVEVKTQVPTTAKFTDTPWPFIYIKKIDADTGELVAGAVFTVAKMTGEIVATVTSRGDGPVAVKVEPGSYVITEIQPPPGYELNDPVKTVEVSKTGALYVSGGGTTGSSGSGSDVTFGNKKLNTIQIVKLDAETLEPLAGAAFEVKKPNGTLLGTFRSNSAGQILIPDLSEGTYIVSETDAPPGYILNSAPQTVNISGGRTVRVEFTNKPLSGIIITKLDSVTLAPLGNAQFTITSSSGERIETVRTGADGTALITGLAEGAYIVGEIDAPPGYILDAHTQSVTVRSGKLTAVEFKNKPLSGIEIIKVDSITHAALRGAGFEVTKSDGTRVGTYYTEADGKVLVNGLDEGVYVVGEVTAPDGYIIDEHPKNVTVVSGKLTSVEFKNKPLSGLEIIKLDADNLTPLANAVFEVEGTDGRKIVTLRTGTDGRATVQELEPGVYIVSEVTAPQGYVLDTGSKRVTVVSGKLASVEFTNRKKSGLQIIKVDAESKAPLKDAKFDVFRMDGSTLGTYTTNSDGVIIIDALEPGWYKVAESKAPNGYLIDDTPKDVEVTASQFIKLTFENRKQSSAQIIKIDAETKAPLKDAKFTVYKANGEVIGTYTTDGNGVIILPNLQPGWYKAAETKAPDGYMLDDIPQDFEITSGQFVKLIFEDKKLPGISILKIDEETRKPIAGAVFLITKSDGARVGEYTTNNQGLIGLSALAPGHYIATETKAPRGYIINPEPRPFEIKAGEVLTLTFENRKESSILIKKIDADTGVGIYGVTFLISDGGDNPMATVTSDQNGYVYLPGIPDGKYYIREIQQAPGYLPDTQVKTFYVEYGTTENITWKNTAQKGQIQITKKSADANPVNGFPAGTYLSGAKFEIYTYAGNLVDTIVSDQNGYAASKPLPIGRYVIREVQAPYNYARLTEPISTEIEFANQIIRLEVQNKSLNIGVTVKKRGLTQVVCGQEMKWSFAQVSNDSNVQLESFYWRDTIPTDAIRLTKIETGTWNANLRYKIVYKTNLNGEYRTLADNLDTAVNRTVAASPAALGLSNGEYVTEIMFAFGTVPAGFRNKTVPNVYGKVLDNLPHLYEFANKTDVGGVSGGNWVQALDRWVTTVWNPGYKPPQDPKLPRTGY